MNLPANEEVSLSLSKIGSDYDAPGCHGLLCGLLVVDISTTLSYWLGELSLSESGRDEPGALNRLSPNTDEGRVDALKEIYDASRHQLQDANLGLQLLMPDDSAPLAERVTALSSWCQGFVLGLSLAGIGKRAELPSDSAEMIGDITQISCADHEESEGQDDEVACFELVEYVKVGVLLINEELQPVKMTTRTTQ